MRGASRLETMVVVVIVSVLLGVAINKLIAYQAAAERAALAANLSAMRDALSLKFVELATRDRVARAADLVSSNPMDQLAREPLNYLGQRDGPDPGTIPGGHWYFDTRSRMLIYRVQHTGEFRGGPPGVPRARFQVRLAYSDRNGNGRFDPGIDAIQGLRLVAVEPYGWKPSVLFPGPAAPKQRTR